MHAGIERWAQRAPSSIALRSGDQDWTYGQLDHLSNGWARRLVLAGVRPGDRVAVLMGNCPELVLAVQAISRAGAAAVLLSPSWKAREAAAALELAEPTHAVVDDSGAALLAPLLPSGRLLTLQQLRGPGAAPLGTTLSPDAESLLVFSSGTTGLPKAVRHTHRSLLHATHHWRDALGLSAADRFQVTTPPTHILGILNLLAAADAGASVRLHRRFDVDEVLHRISTERMTLELAVAPIALAFAQHPDLESFDLSSLRFIMWGATPVTASVAETVTARTGVRWLPAYGASELPVIAANPVSRPDRWRLDSVGLPPEGVTLRVVSLDDGAVLQPGEVGEIQVRSPSLMAGYLPAAATSDVVLPDGWYRTGDIGWVEPEGWVHLTDRSKELIKVNAFQVAPAEIEAVLHGHPAVLDCAVFGVPHAATGETPVAAVVLDPAAGATAADLRSLVAAALASYKRLGHVVEVDQVPRLPSGKVLRRELRDTWAPLLAAREQVDTEPGDAHAP